MADEIVIETTSAEVIEVGVPGPQGPAGAAGSGLETLTTKGDTLFRGQTTGERLPIGSVGQVMKVSSSGVPHWANESGAVTSVNGATGAVTLTPADLDAADANHSHNFSDINVNGVLISGAGNANANGPYLYSGDFGDRGAYHKDKDSLIYWDGSAWLINVNGSDCYSSTQNVSFPYQVTSWSVLPGSGTAPAPTSNARLSGQEFEEIVGQRINPTLRGDAAGKNVGTGANDVAAGNHTHSAATQSVAGFLSAADKTKLDGIAAGAEVNVNADWNATSGDAQILNKPSTFAPSAHSGSHAATGSDPLAPSDIGAQSIFSVESLVITTTAQVTLTAARAKIYDIVQYAGAAVDVKLPSTNAIQGDVVVLRWGTGSNTVNVVQSNSPAVITTVSSGEQKRFIRGSTDSWSLVPVDTHTHNASAITSGTLDIARIPTGTGSTQVALGDHSHTPSEVGLGNVSNTAQVTSVTGTAPIVSSGGTTPAISISAATTSAAGSMSAADKTKLDSVASGATANSSDTTLLARANHTGTQAASTITGLAAIATSGSASDLGSGTIPIARLGASGTPSGSTYLAGDNTWKAAGGVTTGSVDNAIIRADGTGGSTSQGSAFVIADNATASPNNTVNHASIQATGDTTNVSVSIVPKGTGAFSLHVPDAATTGGNARGANAVDFQTSRSAAAQVASGANAVLAGGTGNTASGTQAVVCGGSGNTASGFQSAVLGGRSNAASNDRCVAFGDSNTASFANAVAFGSGNTASSAQALAVGTSSRADRQSLLAHAAGAFAAAGDAQRIRAVLRCATTTNAAVEMALDGGTTYLTIPSGKVMYGEIYVVGVRAGGADVAIYRIVYAAKNIGGTSTEVFSSVTTDAATGTSLEVATVDTGDYIRIRPTGVLNQNWRWVAKADMVEVGHG